ncbi:MAG: EscU/YscU/HrcU family type III secretion system export apparatus switch protein [Sphingomonadales bacterium]
MTEAKTPSDNERAESARQAPRTARAVALSHEPDTTLLPRITAAGLGANAEKIVELALRHGVKVREDPDLAEILSAFEVDSLVPIEVLHAVSEILTYLYQADGRLEERQASLDEMKRAATVSPPEQVDHGAVTAREFDGN